MARETQASLLDRTIIVLVALFLLLLALSLVATALGWRGIGSFPEFVAAVLAHPVESAVGGVVAFLAALHLLFLAVQREAEDGIRQETEIGHVRISLRAIENLAHRTARDVRGIKDVDVEVHPSPEGVAVSLFLVVQPDIQIPRVLDEVGHRVRNQVRETVGIDVGDVSIEIRNISDGTKSRVE